jgi:sarcosine oxidase subunit alpha
LPHGGLIDRNRTLTFSFDGRRLNGHAGDTLASALLANGVHLVGRSFKYHRPRGILAAGSEEPNALVELRTGSRREPNTRATTAELYDGLDAASQNRWPSLAVDLLAINSIAAPLLSAGFYYKTFMWPAAFWEKLYEPLIRRTAGLGRASGESDPDHYEKAFLHCDVLVVGGGPAGLMAALAAGRAGALRVVLCEEDFRLGGRLLADRRIVADRPSAEWSADIVAELAALPGVRLMPRTAVVGVYDGGTYSALERVNDHVAEPPPYAPRQRLWRIVARRAILAAGAIERPLVLGDNDRPGVMLAGAVRAYVNRYAVAPGRRAVVFAANDDSARTAVDLAHAGVEVAAIADPRAEPGPDVVVAAETAGARLIAGSAVVRARGGRHVRAVEVRTASGAAERIACDLLCVSGGWSPIAHLASHLGSRPVWDERLAAFVPGTLPPGMSVAGAASGSLALADALAQGARTGRAAAADCGFEGHQPLEVPGVDPESTAGAPLWRVRGTRGKAFVDLQNDVTADDVALAEREGFRAVEHLKRYTTLGMATDQGKTSNVNGLALMAELTARSIPATGTTGFRPPFVPVAIGAFAGHHRGKAFRPTRLPPSHRWAVEHGAVMGEAGDWLRARWFPLPGETDWLASVSREVAAVRSRVGVCDVSTLGKIDLQGCDAAAFLDRLYINGFANLAVGRTRYGVMLREDGHVLDDGTVARLGDERFVITTTTASAGKVLQHMELAHQWLWPDLDVQFCSVTDQWAQYSVAGPHARDVLWAVVDAGHDISNTAFPYMAAGALSVLGGIPARLYRVSFSGELAYEVAVPAGCGDALMRGIMDAGRPYGIAPYGTEALGVMRIEKGHVGGGELNGQTTARDLGLGRMMSKKKDCIGCALAQRPGLVDSGRPTLVGIKPVDRGARLRAGAHLIPEGAEAVAQNDQGHVTSVAFSPSLGHWIGLGLLARGPARHGERVRAYDPVRGGDTPVEVCPPVFIDPQGERLRG